jgi:3-hydroxyacyl-[acyl-carrier-protein] dehydratase
VEINHVGTKRLLRNRYPILLIDKVNNVKQGQFIIAEKNVTANENCYSNIPVDCEDMNAYIYPATLIIESFCQAAGILHSITINPDGIDLNSINVFGSISNCVFFGDVYPGDKLLHKVNMLKFTKDAGVLSGEVYVENRCIAKIGMLVVGVKASKELVNTLHVIE